MHVTSPDSQTRQASTDDGRQPLSGKCRPSVRGKFVFADDQKVYIRGVTYGPFRPNRSGSEYHTPATVRRDFARMAANNINAVRTYTVPPRWLLDIAQQAGLWVMIGLPWEQHVTFLVDTERMRSIEARVRAGVRACNHHPAVLCYAIGNEIPAPIVRWHGRQKVERFLRRLYRAAKAEDPDSLVTYVNYPTTEYLQLPFLDMVCFNVYLEAQQQFEAYLARLQNIAGDRPLVMAEIGLDSRRNGRAAQAESLDWQIRTAFTAGCAGAFIFAWTDEWYRGGHEIEEWDFGLTDRNREPKPALRAVHSAFTDVPVARRQWPHVSVVVCSYNGARTIRDCLDALMDLDYPNFEVIVVSDGSTDETVTIASEYDVRVIDGENRGLSAARNVGMQAADGTIVAYIDDDAYPDPDWLTYLATSFMNEDYVAVGGPNIAPDGGGLIADCVANAPGGPVHVLVSDREAEHLPGCNMAFRKTALQEIGGFDPQFRVAGDDVDICWRLRERGWTLGFNPAAVVWHHRRPSISAYWEQQIGYGTAEVLLERKWPTKYNVLGHHSWRGRLYGSGVTRRLGWLRGRIYQGTWGSAPFQSLYRPAPTTLLSLSLMPEWYLIILTLSGLTILGMRWHPLFMITAPVLTVAIVLPLGQAVQSARHASYEDVSSRRKRLQAVSLTVLLHLLQPAARLVCRLRWGLTPWRRRGVSGFTLPRPRITALWSEGWQSAEARLTEIEAMVRSRDAVVVRGGDFDRWDLEVRGGAFGAVRLLMAIEEHGGGKQYVRFRVWPRWSILWILAIALLGLLAVSALRDAAYVVSAVLGVAALSLAVRAVGDGAAATALVVDTLAAYEAQVTSEDERDG